MCWANRILNVSEHMKFLLFGKREKSIVHSHMWHPHRVINSQSLQRTQKERKKSDTQMIFLYYKSTHMALTAFSYAWFNYSMACDNFHRWQNINIELCTRRHKEENCVITQCEITAWKFLQGKLLFISFSSLLKKSYERVTFVHKTLISHFSI